MAAAPNAAARNVPCGAEVVDEPAERNRGAVRLRQTDPNRSERRGSRTARWTDGDRIATSGASYGYNGTGGHAVGAATGSARCRDAGRVDRATARPEGVGWTSVVRRDRRSPPPSPRSSGGIPSVQRVSRATVYDRNRSGRRPLDVDLLVDVVEARGVSARRGQRVAACVRLGDQSSRARSTRRGSRRNGIAGDVLHRPNRGARRTPRWRAPHGHRS